MGHINVLANSREELLEKLNYIKTFGKSDCLRGESCWENCRIVENGRVGEGEFKNFHLLISGLQTSSSDF